MKCLVTGATGFTGGYLARALQRAGHEVRALVRPGSDCAGLAQAGVEIREGQLVSADDVLVGRKWLRPDLSHRCGLPYGRTPRQPLPRCQCWRHGERARGCAKARL